MRTRAVRLYGKKDLRLEEFDLPELQPDEILAKVASDSICMSTYKAYLQGSDHKRVPADLETRPILVGHEFCGEIVTVGAKWQHQFQPGMKFTIQPALNYQGSLAAPGYSFPYTGGAATYMILSHEVMESDCLLPYDGPGFFLGSLTEPYSCVIGAFKANYHIKPGTYEHEMGIRPGGNTILMAGTGPMGVATIDYALNCERRPGLFVVTTRNAEKMERIQQLFPPDYAKARGVRLVYVNSEALSDVDAHLMSLTDGQGYDDAFVYAPSVQLVESADSLLAKDGCLNFFAGPSDPQFKAKLNLYNVHYSRTHVAGTSGGTTEDLWDSLRLMADGIIHPETLVTHIGGLNAVAETVDQLPSLPGSKKLIYTHIDLPLLPIDQLESRAQEYPFLRELSQMVADNGGLWSVEAEAFLLQQAPMLAST